MKLRPAFVLPLLFLAWLIAPAQAWFPHGTVSIPATCPLSGGQPDDGCLNAPAGLKQNSAFFTNARQSGQGIYYNAAGVQTSYPLTHELAGVTYPVGQLTADAGLIDAISSPPPGCTWNSSLVYVQCAGTGNTIDISGYKFVGGGLWLTGSGQHLIGADFHFQLTAATCNRFTGVAPVRLGSGQVDLSSGTFDFDATCKNNANQYKTAGDPGFVDQSSGTATLTGNLLHYTAPPTGTVQANQYIYCVGCLMPSRIISGSYPDYLLETPTVHARLTGAALSTTHLTFTGFASGNNAAMQVGDAVTGTGIALGTVLVADNGGNDWTISISQTVASPGTVGITVPQSVASPVTVTTGPVEASLNSAVGSHGGTSKVTYKYIWNEGFPTFAGESGGGDLDVRWNYTVMNGRRNHPLATSTTNDGQHDQFVAWIPGPGSTTLGINSVENYNTILAEAYTDAGIYTSIMSQFSTIGTANAAGGYEVGFNLVDQSYNTIITNLSKVTPGSQISPSMMRVLTQGPAGGGVANVNWSLSAGVVTINAVNSGGPIQVGDTILCTAFPSCSMAVKLTSQIDATRYNSFNTVDTKSNLNSAVARYPGSITTLRTNGNAFDSTGQLSVGPFFVDSSSIAITSRVSNSNWEMTTGAAAN